MHVSQSVIIKEIASEFKIFSKIRLVNTVDQGVVYHFQAFVFIEIKIKSWNPKDKYCRV